jgi:tetratricopeptide (TPR) repeat protein
MSCFNFIVTVWGRSHTQVFVDVGLPSLLAPGNLPGIEALDRSRFHLFTRSDDLAAIEFAPAFRRLRELMTVDIKLMDDWFDGSAQAAPHLLMSRAHREGLHRAFEHGAYSVFIPPECVWADGSLRKLEHIAARGERMVHMTGLRLVLEEAAPPLVAHWRSADGTSMAIPPRDLLRLGLPHLHPITQDNFFREHGGQLMPANLLWTVGDEGVLARCFHLHPLLVEPNERNMTFRKTIDDDLSLVSADDGSRDYVVADSDEIFAFELSRLEHRVTATYHKGSIADVAAWAEIGINARHREFINTAIRLHLGEPTPALWQLIEKEAEDVVCQALALVDQPTANLLGRYDNNVEHRMLAARYRGISTAEWIKAENIPINALPAQVQIAAHREIADAYRAAGDLPRAVVEYDRAIRASGIAALPQVARGQRLRALGDLAGAIAQYDGIICAGQCDPALHYLRATARIELGDHAGALADVEAGLELAGGNAALHFLRDQLRLQIGDARGQALRAAGDLAGAIKHYDETTRTGRCDSALYYLCATARIELGDHAGALADIEAGLALDPGNLTFAFLRDQMHARLAPASQRLRRAMTRWGGRIAGVVFGEGPRVRPWHWRWPYVHEIVRPLARELAAGKGDVLLIENDDMPLASLLADIPRLTVWRSADLHGFVAEAWRRGDQFDKVVCLAPLGDRRWPDALEGLGKLLRPNGDLLLVISDDQADAARRIRDERLSEFRLVELRPQGSLGTALVMAFRNRVHRAAWVQRTQLNPSFLGLVLIPILLVYPLLSLTAILLNLIAGPGRIGLEAVIILRKPIAIVPSDTRAPGERQPEPVLAK